MSSTMFELKLSSLYIYIICVCIDIILVGINRELINAHLSVTS